MRISAERLGLAEQRTNPLGERELVLRGLAISAIENLAATRDAFDTIDFTDNRISRLENFPRLERLVHLMLDQNVVDSIDVSNLSKNVPNLQYLELAHNHVASLKQVANLGKACPKLQTLSLVGNPVTRRQHYRLYVIHHISTLRVLDYVKITQSERDKAQRLAKSAAGAALEQDVQKEEANTFIPGQGKTAQESFATSFTAQQKEQIKQMVANAKSPQEIEEIELSVQRGIFPGSTSASTTVTPPTESETNGNRKRKASDEDNEGDDASKRSRTEEKQAS